MVGYSEISHCPRDLADYLTFNHPGHLRVNVRASRASIRGIETILPFK
jgi:hypothetical protein